LADDMVMPEEKARKGNRISQQLFILEA
jgi:hypothetical protein